MKFTEEQYQKIVDAWDSQIMYKSATQSVIDELKVGYLNMVDQALALANPLTREWAHDKFVEKEKKYYWSTKKRNEQGKPMVLFNGAGGIVQMMGPKQPLTESEIREWGYNPYMFDREEVQ